MGRDHGDRQSPTQREEHRARGEQSQSSRANQRERGAPDRTRELSGRQGYAKQTRGQVQRTRGQARLGEHTAATHTGWSHQRALFKIYWM